MPMSRQLDTALRQLRSRHSVVNGPRAGFHATLILRLRCRRSAVGGSVHAQAIALRWLNGADTDRSGDRELINHHNRSCAPAPRLQSRAVAPATGVGGFWTNTARAQPAACEGGE